MLTLEALLVAMILLGAIAMVSLTPIHQPTPPTIFAYQTHVEDALRALDQLPTQDRYHRLLDKAVAKAVLDNTTALDDTLRQVLPPGSECQLWIHNGRAPRQLTGPPPGWMRQVASGSRLYHAIWSYAQAFPTLDLVHHDTPLELLAYAVSQGSLIREAGIPVQATLTTSQGNYSAAAITSIRDAPSATVRILNETGQPSHIYQDLLQTSVVHTSSHPGAPGPGNFTVPGSAVAMSANLSVDGPAYTFTLTFTSPNGVPTAYPVHGQGAQSFSIPLPVDWGTWTFNSVPLAPPVSSDLNVTVQSVSPNEEWSFLLQAEAHDLPVGTNLTLKLPWAFDPSTPHADPGWKNTHASRLHETGVTVSAELATPLPAGQERILRVPATRVTELIPGLSRIDASLGNGTSGQASFAIIDPGIPTQSFVPITRGLALSAPKPMAPLQPANWSVLVTYPSLTTLGAPEYLTRLELAIPEGQALFHALTPLEPSSGWSVTPTRLTWTGNVTLLPNQAYAFRFMLTPTATTTPHEPTLALPFHFPGAGTSFQTHHRAQAHVYHATIPPNGTEPGYTVPALGLLDTQPALGSIAWHARSALADGSLAYNVTNTPNLDKLQDLLRLGLSRSSVTLTQPHAGIGGAVQARVDFQGLYDALGFGIAGFGLGSQQGEVMTYPAWNLNVSGWRVDLHVLDPSQPLAPRHEWVPLASASYGVNHTAQATVLQGSSPVQGVKSIEIDTSPEVHSPAAATFTLQVRDDTFFGPHPILAEARFTIWNGAITLHQTARALALLNVQPDPGQPSSTLYTVILTCGIPDL